ncbi:hypothetical protein K9U51_25665 [Enterobacter hormaechei]|uniref:hypothetical protein n=1 Tax=Enterobacter hormaechei TaxID=158836 RepID=UPI0040675B6F
MKDQFIVACREYFVKERVKTRHPRKNPRNVETRRYRATSETTGDITCPLRAYS